MVKKLSSKDAEKLRRRREAEEKRRTQPPLETWLEGDDDDKD